MSKTTRRESVRRNGIGVVGVSALQFNPLAHTAVSSRAEAIPDHRALDVPGVHAYPMEHSIAAGDTLELCVSASVPYSMSICRLGWKVDEPAGDAVMADLGGQAANPQPIHPDAYVHVAK